MWALWSVACVCVFQTRRRVSLCEHFDQWLVYVVFSRQGEESPYVSTLISGLCMWCFPDKEKSLPMWALWSVACVCAFQTRRRVSLCEHFDQWLVYVVFFRQGEESPYVSTSFPLPTVNIEHIPISVHLQLPAFGRVKTLLPLTYVIRNRTTYVQELEINMESTDNFMFSGNKQVGCLWR